MQPSEPGEVLVKTVRVARAAFPKRSLAIRVQDELRPLFRDEKFADLSRSFRLPGCRNKERGPGDDGEE